MGRRSIVGILWINRSGDDVDESKSVPRHAALCHMQPLNERNICFWNFLNRAHRMFIPCTASETTAACT